MAARSHPTPPQAHRIRPGELLAGKYRIERVLGEGGMGTVVAARHELLQQSVAVKFLRGSESDPEAVSRLLREARSTAKLQSDHVARILDVDTDPDGTPFVVMELLEGCDLCEVADARGALPRFLVLDYVLQVLEGLAHAHARGVIHRDLKPSNLFLAKRADGTEIIKILDFGISVSVHGEGEAERTRELGLLGSPPYMSPEQIRNPASVDHRTDIWSLGVIMYELLSNSMPFGGNVDETLRQILERQPTPLRQLASHVPQGLEEVVHRCLAKDREHRYRNVAELALALMPFTSGRSTEVVDRIATILARVASARVTEEPIGSRNAPTRDVARKRALRLPLLVIAPAVVGIGIVVAAIALRGSERRSEAIESVAPTVSSEPMVVPSKTVPDAPVAEPAPTRDPAPSASVVPLRPTPRKPAGPARPSLPRGLPRSRD